MQKNSYQKLIIHTDGAARGNPGRAGVGAVIFDGRGKIINKISEYIGETTNNVAEYKALILALVESEQYKAPDIEVCSDSQLLVQQITGEYKVKNPVLKPLVVKVKKLLSKYDKKSIKYISREQNAGADKLANEAIDGFQAGKKEEKKLEGIAEQEKLF